MICTNCRSVLAEGASFCDNCGTAVSAPSGPSAMPSFEPVGAFPAVAEQASPMPMAAVTYGLVQEDKAKRVVGFLIDLVPALLLALMNLLPIIGWMFHGLFSGVYWLLRDINGASLGKMALGGMVYSEDGRPATVGQRILRNVPLAIPGFLGLIPVVGIGFELVAFVIFIVEIFVLLVTGRRIGDRLAGTTVVRRPV